jgi:hypothetical protein
VSWTERPPDNLPVLVCHETRLIYSPILLEYDPRDFWVPDDEIFGRLIHIHTGEPGSPPFDKVLSPESWGVVWKEKFRPDDRHGVVFNQAGSPVLWLKRKFGLNLMPWTEQGEWREMSEWVDGWKSR